MLFALGLGDEVAAVTHECDHPPEALELPKVTRDVIGPGLPPDEIDRAVRELTEQGRSIYELDEDALRRAAARPDRHAGAVRRLRGLLRRRARDRRAAGLRAARCVALDPHTLGEVLGDVRTLAAGDRRQGRRRRPRAGRRGADRPRAARRARGAQPVRGRRARVARPGVRRRPLDAAADRVRGRLRRARHARASTPSSARGRRSRAAQPEVVIVMPCGYDAERALEEADDYADELASLGARRVVAVDAAAYFSRPGPRLVDGLELLAHVLHPDRLPERRRAWSRGRALDRELSRWRSADRARPRSRSRSPTQTSTAGTAERPPASRPRSTASAASTPPIRPPTWPPIEMFSPGQEREHEVEDRITAPGPTPSRSIPRARGITNAAPIRPKTAPRRRPSARVGARAASRRTSRPAATAK